MPKIRREVFSVAIVTLVLAVGIGVSVAALNRQTNKPASAGVCGNGAGCYSGGCPANRPKDGGNSSQCTIPGQHLCYSDSCTGDATKDQPGNPTGNGNGDQLNSDGTCKNGGRYCPGFSCNNNSSYGSDNCYTGGDCSTRYSVCGSSGLKNTAPSSSTPVVSAGTNSNNQNCSFCGGANQGACDGNVIAGVNYVCSFGCKSGLVFCTNTGSCQSACSDPKYADVGPASSNPSAYAAAQQAAAAASGSTTVTAPTGAKVTITTKAKTALTGAKCDANFGLCQAIDPTSGQVTGWVPATQPVYCDSSCALIARYNVIVGNGFQTVYVRPDGTISTTQSSPADKKYNAYDFSGGLQQDSLSKLSPEQVAAIKKVADANQVVIGANSVASPNANITQADLDQIKSKVDAFNSEQTIVQKAFVDNINKKTQELVQGCPSCSANDINNKIATDPFLHFNLLPPDLQKNIADDTSKYLGQIASSNQRVTSCINLGASCDPTKVPGITPEELAKAKDRIQVLNLANDYQNGKTLSPGEISKIKDGLGSDFTAVQNSRDKYLVIQAFTNILNNPNVPQSAYTANIPTAILPLLTARLDNYQTLQKQFAACTTNCGSFAQKYLDFGFTDAGFKSLLAAKNTISDPLAAQNFLTSAARISQSSSPDRAEEQITLLKNQLSPTAQSLVSQTYLQQSIDQKIANSLSNVGGDVNYYCSQIAQTVNISCSEKGDNTSSKTNLSAYQALISVTSDQNLKQGLAAQYIQNALIAQALVTGQKTTVITGSPVKEDVLKNQQALIAADPTSTTNKATISSLSSQLGVTPTNLTQTLTKNYYQQLLASNYANGQIDSCGFVDPKALAPDSSEPFIAGCYQLASKIASLEKSGVVTANDKSQAYIQSGFVSSVNLNLSNDLVKIALDKLYSEGKLSVTKTAFTNAIDTKIRVSTGLDQTEFQAYRTLVQDRTFVALNRDHMEQIKADIFSGKLVPSKMQTALNYQMDSLWQNDQRGWLLVQVNTLTGGEYASGAEQQKAGLDTGNISQATLGTVRMFASTAAVPLGIVAAASCSVTLGTFVPGCLAAGLTYSAALSSWGHTAVACDSTQKAFSGWGCTTSFGNATILSLGAGLSMPSVNANILSAAKFEAAVDALNAKNETQAATLFQQGITAAAKVPTFITKLAQTNQILTPIVFLGNAVDPCIIHFNPGSCALTASMFATSVLRVLPATANIPGIGATDVAVNAGFGLQSCGAFILGTGDFNGCLQGAGFTGIAIGHAAQPAGLDANLPKAGEITLEEAVAKYQAEPTEYNKSILNQAYSAEISLTKAVTVAKDFTVKGPTLASEVAFVKLQTEFAGKTELTQAEKIQLVSAYNLAQADAILVTYDPRNFAQKFFKNAAYDALKVAQDNFKTASTPENRAALETAKLVADIAYTPAAQRAAILSSIDAQIQKLQANKTKLESVLVEDPTDTTALQQLVATDSQLEVVFLRRKVADQKINPDSLAGIAEIAPTQAETIIENVPITRQAVNPADKNLVVVAATKPASSTQTEINSAQASLDVAIASYNSDQAPANRTAVIRAETKLLELQHQELVARQAELLRQAGKTDQAQQLTDRPVFTLQSTDPETQAAVDWTVRSMESKVNKLWAQTGKADDGSVFSFKQEQVAAALNLTEHPEALGMLFAGGGKTQAVASLFLELNYLLTGKPATFLAKEGQGVEAAGILRPILGDDLYYLRPATRAVDAAAGITGAKFILTEPSGVAFLLLEGLQTSASTETLASVRTVMDALKGNKLFDEFPTAVDPRNRWISATGTDGKVSADAAQIAAILKIQQAFTDVGFFANNSDGPTSRVNKSGLIQDGHLTDEGTKLLMTKLGENGAFGKATPEQINRTLEAYNTRNVDELTQLVTEGVDVNQVRLVVDALAKTAQVFDSTLGQETFQGATIGKGGNVQANVQDSDVLSGMARKMLTTWAYERAVATPEQLQAVSVTGQSIGFSPQDLIAINTILSKVAPAGMTGTPYSIARIAQTLGYSVDMATVVANYQAGIQKVRSAAISVHENATNPELVADWVKAMRNGDLGTSPQDKHIVAMLLGMDKMDVATILVKQGLDPAKRNIVFTAEDGQMYKLTQDRNGTLHLDQNVTEQYSNVNISSTKIAQGTILVIMEGKTIGGNYPANSDVTFAAVVDGNYATMDGAIQTLARGSRVEGQTLQYNGFITNISKDNFVDQLSRNTETQIKNDMVQNLLAQATTQAKLPLFEAYFRLVDAGNFTDAQKVAELLSQIDRTSNESIQTSLARSEIDTQLLLQQHDQTLVAKIEDITNGQIYKDLVTQKVLTDQEVQGLNRTLDARSLSTTIAATGGDIAKIIITPNGGLADLIALRNANLSLDFVPEKSDGSAPPVLAQERPSQEAPVAETTLPTEQEAALAYADPGETIASQPSAVEAMLQAFRGVTTVATQQVPNVVTAVLNPVQAMLQGFATVTTKTPSSLPSVTPKVTLGVEVLPDPITLTAGTTAQTADGATLVVEQNQWVPQKTAAQRAIPLMSAAVDLARAAIGLRLGNAFGLPLQKGQVFEVILPGSKVVAVATADQETLNFIDSVSKGEQSVQVVIDGKTFIRNTQGQWAAVGEAPALVAEKIAATEPVVAVAETPAETPVVQVVQEEIATDQEALQIMDTLNLFKFSNYRFAAKAKKIAINSLTNKLVTLKPAKSTAKFTDINTPEIETALQEAGLTPTVENDLGLQQVHQDLVDTIGARIFALRTQAYPQEQVAENPLPEVPTATEPSLDIYSIGMLGHLEAGLTSPEFIMQDVLDRLGGQQDLIPVLSRLVPLYNVLLPLGPQEAQATLNRYPTATWLTIVEVYKGVKQDIQNNPEVILSRPYTLSDTDQAFDPVKLIENYLRSKNTFTSLSQQDQDVLYSLASVELNPNYQNTLTNHPSVTQNQPAEPSIFAGVGKLIAHATVVAFTAIGIVAIVASTALSALAKAPPVALPAPAVQVEIAQSNSPFGFAASDFVLAPKNAAKPAQAVSGFILGNSLYPQLAGETRKIVTLDGQTVQWTGSAAPIPFQSANSTILTNTPTTIDGHLGFYTDTGTPQNYTFGVDKSGNPLFAQSTNLVWGISNPNPLFVIKGLNGVAETYIFADQKVFGFSDGNGVILTVPGALQLKVGKLTQEQIDNAIKSASVVQKVYTDQLTYDPIQYLDSQGNVIARYSPTLTAALAGTDILNDQKGTVSGVYEIAGNKFVVFKNGQMELIGQGKIDLTGEGKYFAPEFVKRTVNIATPNYAGNFKAPLTNKANVQTVWVKYDSMVGDNYKNPSLVFDAQTLQSQDQVLVPIFSTDRSTIAFYEVAYKTAFSATYSYTNAYLLGADNQAESLYITDSDLTKIASGYQGPMVYTDSRGHVAAFYVPLSPEVANKPDLSSATPEELVSAAQPNVFIIRDIETGKTSFLYKDPKAELYFDNQLPTAQQIKKTLLDSGKTDPNQIIAFSKNIKLLPADNFYPEMDAVARIVIHTSEKQGQDTTQWSNDITFRGLAADGFSSQAGVDGTGTMQFTNQFTQTKVQKSKSVDQLNTGTLSVEMAGNTADFTAENIKNDPVVKATIKNTVNLVADWMEQYDVSFAKVVGHFEILGQPRDDPGPAAMQAIRDGLDTELTRRELRLGQPSQDQVKVTTQKSVTDASLSGLDLQLALQKIVDTPSAKIGFAARTIDQLEQQGYDVSPSLIQALNHIERNYLLRPGQEVQCIGWAIAMASTGVTDVSIGGQVIRNDKFLGSNQHVGDPATQARQMVPQEIIDGKAKTIDVGSHTIAVRIDSIDEIQAKDVFFLYRDGNDHVGIIVDVQKDAAGHVTKLLVSEANRKNDGEAHTEWVDRADFDKREDDHIVVFRHAPGYSLDQTNPQGQIPFLVGLGSAFSAFANNLPALAPLVSQNLSLISSYLNILQNFGAQGLVNFIFLRPSNPTTQLLIANGIAKNLQSPALLTFVNERIFDAGHRLPLPELILQPGTKNSLSEADLSAWKIGTAPALEPQDVYASFALPMLLGNGERIVSRSDLKNLFGSNLVPTTVQNLAGDYKIRLATFAMLKALGPEYKLVRAGAGDEYLITTKNGALTEQQIESKILEGLSQVKTLEFVNGEVVLNPIGIEFKNETPAEKYTIPVRPGTLAQRRQRLIETHPEVTNLLPQNSSEGLVSLVENILYDDILSNVAIRIEQDCGCQVHGFRDRGDFILHSQKGYLVMTDLADALKYVNENEGLAAGNELVTDFTYKTLKTVADLGNTETVVWRRGSQLTIQTDSLEKAQAIQQALRTLPTSSVINGRTIPWMTGIAIAPLNYPDNVTNAQKTQLFNASYGTGSEDLWKDQIRVIGQINNPEFNFRFFNPASKRGEPRLVKQGATTQDIANLTNVYATGNQDQVNVALQKFLGADYPEISPDEIDGDTIISSTPPQTTTFKSNVGKVDLKSELTVSDETANSIVSEIISAGGMTHLPQADWLMTGTQVSGSSYVYQGEKYVVKQVNTGPSVQNFNLNRIEKYKETVNRSQELLNEKGIKSYAPITFVTRMDQPNPLFIVQKFVNGKEITNIKDAKPFITILKSSGLEMTDPINNIISTTQGPVIIDLESIQPLSPTPPKTPILEKLGLQYTDATGTHLKWPWQEVGQLIANTQQATIIASVLKNGLLSGQTLMQIGATAQFSATAQTDESKLYGRTWQPADGPVALHNALYKQDLNSVIDVMGERALADGGIADNGQTQPSFKEQVKANILVVSNTDLTGDTHNIPSLDPAKFLKIYVPKELYNKHKELFTGLKNIAVVGYKNESFSFPNYLTNVQYTDNKVAAPDYESAILQDFAQTGKTLWFSGVRLPTQYSVQPSTPPQTTNNTNLEVTGGLGITDPSEVAYFVQADKDVALLKSDYPRPLQSPFFYHTTDVSALNFIKESGKITAKNSTDPVFVISDQIDSQGKVVRYGFDSQGESAAALKPGKVTLVFDNSITSLPGFALGPNDIYPTISQIPVSSIRAILTTEVDRSQAELLAQSLNQTYNLKIPVIYSVAWQNFAYSTQQSSIPLQTAQPKLSVPVFGSTFLGTVISASLPFAPGLQVINDNLPTIVTQIQVAKDLLPVWIKNTFAKFKPASPKVQLTNNIARKSNAAPKIIFAIESTENPDLTTEKISELFKPSYSPQIMTYLGSYTIENLTTTLNKLTILISYLDVQNTSIDFLHEFISSDYEETNAALDQLIAMQKSLPQVIKSIEDSNFRKKFPVTSNEAEKIALTSSNPTETGQTLGDLIKKFKRTTQSWAIGTIISTIYHAPIGDRPGIISKTQKFSGGLLAASDHLNKIGMTQGRIEVIIDQTIKESDTNLALSNINSLKKSDLNVFKKLTTSGHPFQEELIMALLNNHDMAKTISELDSIDLATFNDFVYSLDLSSNSSWYPARDLTISNMSRALNQQSPSEFIKKFVYVIQTNVKNRNSTPDTLRGVVFAIFNSNNLDEALQKIVDNSENFRTFTEATEKLDSHLATSMFAYATWLKNPNSATLTKEIENLSFLFSARGAKDFNHNLFRALSLSNGPQQLMDKLHALLNNTDSDNTITIMKSLGKSNQPDILIDTLKNIFALIKNSQADQAIETIYESENSDLAANNILMALQTGKLEFFPENGSLFLAVSKNPSTEFIDYLNSNSENIPPAAYRVIAEAPDPFVKAKEMVVLESNIKNRIPNDPQLVVNVFNRILFAASKAEGYDQVLIDSASKNIDILVDTLASLEKKPETINNLHNLVVRAILNSDDIVSKNSEFLSYNNTLQSYNLDQNLTDIFIQTWLKVQSRPTELTRLNDTTVIVLNSPRVKSLISTNKEGGIKISKIVQRIFVNPDSLPLAPRFLLAYPAVRFTVPQSKTILGLVLTNPEAMVSNYSYVYYTTFQSGHYPELSNWLASLDIAPRVNDSSFIQVNGIINNLKTDADSFEARLLNNQPLSDQDYLYYEVYLKMLDENFTADIAKINQTLKTSNDLKTTDEAIKTTGIAQRVVQNFQLQSENVTLTLPVDVDSALKDLIKNALEQSESPDLESIKLKIAGIKNNIDSFNVDYFKQNKVPQKLINDKDSASIFAFLISRTLQLNPQEKLWIIKQIINEIGSTNATDYINGNLSIQDSNSFLTNISESETILTDTLASLGISDSRAAITASPEWKIIKNAKAQLKIANDAAASRSKSIDVQLIFEKKKLVDLFQGKTSGTCFGDCPFDIARPNLVTMKMVANGEIVGNVLFTIQGSNLIMIGFDPSQFFVGNLTQTARNSLADETMKRIYVAAKENGLRLLVTNQAGGLSNRQGFEGYILENFVSSTQIPVRQETFQPIFKYTIKTAAELKPEVIKKFDLFYNQTKKSLTP